jgi:3,4-dihydroxyphenylacetate 2,3-dioxygenase
MGRIVGAAIVSPHPGLAQPREGDVRTDLLEVVASVRTKIDAVNADTFVIFDSHWTTTSMPLVSDISPYHSSIKLPFAIFPLASDYRGTPELVALVETAAQERKVLARKLADETVLLHAPTINLLHLLGRGERLLIVSTCRGATCDHLLQMGKVVATAVERSDARAVLLACGPMSDKLHDIDLVPPNPRALQPDKLSDASNRAFFQSCDRGVLNDWEQGAHDRVLSSFTALHQPFDTRSSADARVFDDFPELPPANNEGDGAPYVQMVGALGGATCRAKGTKLSDYENVAGIGHAFVWFDLEPGAATQHLA